MNHKVGCLVNCLLQRWHLQLLSRNISCSSSLLREKHVKKIKYNRNDEEMPIFQYASKNSKPRKRVYTWGMCSTGALGNKKYLMPEKENVSPIFYVHKPCRLGFSDYHDVVDIVCGHGFTVLVIKSDDGPSQVFGTGLNTDCQIGYHCNRPGHPLEMLLEPVPIEIPLVSKSTKVLQVACGRGHTAVLTDVEGAFLLGNNAFGQCGRHIIDNENYSRCTIINKIHGIPGKIKKVICGQDHTLFLTEEGHVYSCGLGSDGQTGLGHYKCESIPQRCLGDIKSENIVHLSSYADCVLALNDKGEVFGWGNSEYNQLKVATSEQQLSTPMHLPMPSSVGKVTDVTSGGTMCAIISESGQVYVWGYGILGKGPKVMVIDTPELLPQPLFGVNEFDSDRRVVKIKAGLDCFAATIDSGDVYMWGRNDHGKLGLGSTENQYFPLRVSVGGQVEKISIGTTHTAIITKAFM